jgi:hypothetical protein
MRKSTPLILILLIMAICVPCVQATQILPFAPPANVTGSYEYSQGNDNLELFTNFPISSQDIVFPEWLFAMILIFIFVTICLGLAFFLKGPEAWVNVLACGIIIFGLGLTAAMMAPLVGSSHVYQQVIPYLGANGASLPNSTNTIYVHQVIVYTLGTWVSYGCWGLAIGGGFIFAIAGVLLQMKQARIIANKVQAERIQAEEINFRARDRK